MKAFIALVLLALRSGGTFAQEACDAACQAAFERSLQSESASWVSQNATLEDFYSTPDNSSTAKPGDVLRWESIPRATVNTNYSIPAGTSLHRFLYMTEDMERKPIPASAFVLLPFVNPPTGCNNKVFKTLAWAHGTAGRSRQCAPHRRTSSSPGIFQREFRSEPDKGARSRRSLQPFSPGSQSTGLPGRRAHQYRRTECTAAAVCRPPRSVTRSI